MTLSRKIFLKNAALLASLAMLATAALVGLVSMREDVSVALDEYNELRLIERTGLHVATARGLLMDDHPDRDEILSEITQAIDGLNRFSDTSSDLREGSEHHEALEESLGAAALSQMRQVKSQIETSGMESARDKELELAMIQSGLDDLTRLSGEMDHLAEATRSRAARKMRNTTLLLAGLSGVAILGAVAVSVWQYRGVMRPLGRLRAGVRSISAGQLDQRLEEEGEVEFAELTRDFNGMAEELRDLYRSLEDKVMAKSRELARSERLASVGFLAAGVAHEINNPLNIISGYAELSLDQLAHGSIASIPAVAEAHQAMRIIVEEAFRCKQITEKLLSLAKPGSGNRQTLSLARLARETGALIGGLKQYRDRRLIVDAAEAGGDDDNDDNDLLISANATEMKQVLLNLTLNALESVSPGSGEVRITTAQNNGWVEMRVEDNGSGMTSDVLDRVFEPFFSAKAGASGNRGVGLGMSISHAIVESHGGVILAASPGPGRGSTFTIRLPAANAAANATATPRGEPVT